MRHERGNALILLLALVATVAVVEGIFLIRLAGRIGELENQFAGPEGSGTSPGALGQRVLELEGTVADTAMSVDAVAEATDRLEAETRTHARQLDVLTRGSSEAGGGEAEEADPGGRIAPAALEEAVARAVDRQVEQRLKGMPQQEGGEWKPSLQQFKESLALDEEQTRRAEEIFDNGKHEVFQLASLKGDDGRSKVDELVDALRNSEDPGAAGKQFFMSLFKDKIPGRDETYIVEILRIKEQTEKGIRSVLSDEQKTKLSRMNLDYLGVHTSYDPFAEYIQESLR